MAQLDQQKKITLSVVIPCFNEETTLKRCIQRVLAIGDVSLALEIIVVDDGSTDGSLSVARDLAEKHSEIKVVQHETNQGKGASLRTGFKSATGHFVAVQDADLEYDPFDLKRLLVPLMNNDADVVLGSRFLSTGAHRVLYFWHYLGNRLLTFVSNMFTDLNLTDMETCYKVFRRDVIERIDIKENRFGFEPEIVAKIAHMRLRIFEMGVSYRGRTYEEGKKIGVKDGFRAVYCIFRYNAHRAPLPVQFIFYTFIGGMAALINILAFLSMFSAGLSVNIAAPAAFIIAAVVNYILCVLLLFRHKARWGTVTEQIFYWFVVGMVCIIDFAVTRFLLTWGLTPWVSKLLASLVGLVLNFSGRRFMVFPEPPSGSWRAQDNIQKFESNE